MYYRIDAAAKLLARIGAGLVKKKIQVKGKDGKSFLRSYLVRSGAEPTPIPKQQSKPAITKSSVIEAIRRSKQTGMPTSIGGDLMAYVMKGKKLTPQERREIRGNAGIRNAEEQRAFEEKIDKLIEINKRKPSLRTISRASKKWEAKKRGYGSGLDPNPDEDRLAELLFRLGSEIEEKKKLVGNDKNGWKTINITSSEDIFAQQARDNLGYALQLFGESIHNTERYLIKKDGIYIQHHGQNQKDVLGVIRQMEEEYSEGTELSDILSTYVREFPYEKTLNPKVKEKMDKVAADAPHISPEESYSLCQYIGIDYEPMNVSIRGDVKVRHTPEGNEVRIRDPHGVKPDVSYMSKFSPSTGNLSDIAKATEDDPRQSYFAQSKAAVIALRKLPPLSEEGVKKAYADSDLHDRVRDVPEEFFSRPREEQLLRRGLGVPEESLPAFIASHRPGKIVKDKGFASTSLAILPDWAEHKSTVEYRIDWKRDGKTQGKFVDHYKRTNIEHEVLFPPMVKFLVTAPPKQDNGKWIIHLKEM